MKTAVIGSRSLINVDIQEYLTEGTDEIISGGARGVDSCAAEYALGRGIKLTLIEPDYKRYGRAAPIVRNREIIRLADIIIVIWDGESRGSAHVITEAGKMGKDVRVFILPKWE